MTGLRRIFYAAISTLCLWLAGRLTTGAGTLKRWAVLFDRKAKS